MKRRDYVLTGILLVLIGVFGGTLIALYSINDDLAPLAEVRFTEIKKSESPYFNESELATLDSRFHFKNVAETVTPSVVYIEAIIPIESSLPQDGNHEFDEGFWDRMMPRRTRTVGSGIVITQDGYILTNNHVVEDAVKNGLKVVLNDKREYPASIVGVDPSTDLAVIKIKAQNLSSITVGNSENVTVGEWVLAVGNPFRLRSTVTAGIVSALSRDVQIIDDNFRIESFIQTDAAINRGNSGGALVNTSAQLIGVNTAIASQSGTYQGYGFAVPSNLAIKVAKDLIEFGKVQRALLGVNIASVNYTRALMLGLDEVKGVEIVGMDRNGAAYEGGIREGDVILKVNNMVVNESNQLQEKVAILSPGDNVDLFIWRNGKELTKTISLKMLEMETFEELSFEDSPVDMQEINPRDSQSQEEGDYNNTGIEFGSFNLGFIIMAIAKPENLNTYELIITKVVKDSEAWKRGLREKSKIVAVNEIKVQDISTLRKTINDELKNNKEVILETLNEENARGYYLLKSNNE